MWINRYGTSILISVVRRPFIHMYYVPIYQVDYQKMCGANVRHLRFHS